MGLCPRIPAAPGEPAPAALLQARGLRDAGRLEEASAAYQEYLRQDPEAWTARYELSQIFMTLKRLDDAETQLQAGLLSAPREALLWARLGQVYLLKGDVEHAERALVASRDIDASDPGVRYNLGRLYEKQARDEDALVEYLAFIELAPNDERAKGVRRRVALYYENSNKPREAIEQYRALESMEPERVEYHQLLGDLLYRQAEYDAADLEYRKALDLDPNSAPALFNVGFIAKMKGNLEEAETFLTKSDALAPNQIKTLYTLAAVRFDRGNFEGAISCLERVVAGEPEHPQAHYYYARALAKLGRAEDARKEMQIHQEILKKIREKDTVPSTMGGD